MEDKPERDEPLIQYLQKVIGFCVRGLAVLMTAVIAWGVLDVAWVLYGRLTHAALLPVKHQRHPGYVRGLHGRVDRH